MKQAGIGIVSGCYHRDSSGSIHFPDQQYGHNGITVRREEIAIMKYIGAKDGFVRAPFIIEGILIGLVGAAIPLGIFYVLYNKAITYILTKFSLLNNILDFLPVGQVYKTLLPVGLLLGIGIGFVGSFFTIRKHLRV